MKLTRIPSGLALPIVLFLVLAPVLRGQSTWNGSQSSVWNLAGNWTGSVPGGATDVVIPSGTPNSPSTNGVSGATCRDLTVNAGATLTCASGFPLASTRSVTVNGAVNGAGGLRLTGATTGNLDGGGTIGTNLEVAKGAGVTITLASSLIVGSFTLTSGTFTASSPTLTVTGSALFQGGVLQNAGFSGIYDVGGDVTFSGTVATGQQSFIRCAGNWTSDANFSPNSAAGVIFDGTVAHTISAAGAFENLTIAAGAIMSASNLTVNGALVADGSLTLSGALDANGNVTVGVTGALDVGGGTDTFAMNLTVSGSFTSTGTIVFDGSNNGSVSSVSQLSNVQVAKAGSSLFWGGNVTASSFTLTSGTLVVSSLTLTVAGNALFQGGTLGENFSSTIDVGGNVTFSGTNATGQVPSIGCGGNWTSDANFSPAGNGAVTFHRTGAQTISAAGPFQALTIAAGSITTASNLTVNGPLVANGSLAVSGTLDANGHVTVGVSGALDVGGGTDTFAGSLDASGTFTSTGTVVFDGSASGNLSSVSPLPNVQLAKAAGASSLSLTSNVTASSLTLISGTLIVSQLPGATLTVTGNASFQGGTLRSNFSGTVDVGGNVTFAGTSIPGNVAAPTIRCHGNWTADANWAPGSGLVELNGSSPTTIAAAASGGTVSFFDLVIKNGPKTMVNDFTIAATNMTIDPTGSLAVSTGRHLSVHQPSVATSVAVNGPLTIAANGELSMGPQTSMTVGSTGTLSLVGSGGQPSKITGAAGGGYAAVVNGTLSASNFLVKEMGPGGFVIGLGATIAAAPNNLANGTFDFRAGASAGSVLLDLRRQAPAADFTGLTFLNTPAASGVFNVTTAPSGVPVGFTAYAGGFAGPAFENDPSGLITWNLQSAPPVGEFRVRLGAELVEILWHAANNTGIVGYEVRHSPSPSGPFTLVATQGVGNPGNGYVDVPLAANVPEWEAVWAVMSGGERMLFGVGTATPYSANPPPNVYVVGNGPFATIQAGINAATAPNSVVMVTPGTYPAFTIGSSAPQNLHIAGVGAGAVNIDTSSGPITISNISAGNGVELGGLSIGNASTAQPGVQVISCAGTIVLDALTVACDGSQTAVSVSGSPKVAIQRCAISGGTGLSVAGSSHVGLSKGSLTSLNSTGSTIEMADLTPGSVSVTPAGSLLTRGGIMPNMVVNRFASMAHPQVMTIDAFPNAAYIPVASPTMSFTNLAGFEMPILIDPGYVFIFSAMMTDAAGHGVSPFEIEPALVLLGFTYVAQVACLDPVSSTFRMSNSVTVTSMP